jgi:hypothetical protein
MVRVGGDGAPSTRPGPAPELGPAPAVRRLRSSRWRDPRLAVGVVLVAGSVVVGARVIDAADDTVPVWSLRNDVPAGSELSADDVTISRVNFDEAGDAERYFDGDDPIPDELVVGHDLVAGELLARSALAEPESEAISELSLSVADGFYPVDLQPGDRVSVWVAPSDGTDQRRIADVVFESVPVLQTDSASSDLSGDATTDVLLGLDADAVASLDRSLAQISIGSVFLIREGD